MKTKYTFRGIALALLKSLGYIAVWFVVTQLASLLVQVLLMSRYKGSSPEAIMALYNQNATQVLLIANSLTLIVFMIIYKCRKKSLATRCEITSKPFGAYTRGILLGILGQFAIQYLLSMLITANLIPAQWLGALEENNESLVTAPVTINIITTVLIGPIFEEILCRGLMLGALKKAMPAWLAVGVSSLVFGLLHGNPIGIIYATLFGILLGFVAIKLNSIMPSILCHIAFNFTSFMLSENGGELGLFGVLLLNASIPLLVVLIIKTAKYKEPVSHSEDEEGE
jgi:membrane protease YdiL (CAAX protease family)